MRLRDARGRTMTATTQSLTVRRIAAARMPTKWGMFQTMAFERVIVNGGEKGIRHLLCEAPCGPFRQKVPDPFFAGRRHTDTGLALVLGEVSDGAPLVRIHSQCFTGDV